MTLQIQPAVLRLGEEPTRLDLMTACDGCEWKDAWQRRLMIDIDGMRVPVLSLADLRAAKAAAGRHRDLDDLENLPTVDDLGSQDESGVEVDEA